MTRHAPTPRDRRQLHYGFVVVALLVVALFAGSATRSVPNAAADSPHADIGVSFTADPGSDVQVRDPNVPTQTATMSYTILLQNSGNGSADAHNVLLTNTLP